MFLHRGEKPREKVPEQGRRAGPLRRLLGRALGPAKAYSLNLLSRLRRRSEDPDSPWALRFFSRYARSLILAAMSFATNQVPVRASALTYTTFLSIVPFLVILSAVAGLFGYLNILQGFVPYLNETLNLNLPLDRVMSVIRNAQQTDFRQLGLVGSGGLLVTFLIFMGNIEKAMDHIWDVAKRRSIPARIKEYLPFLLLLIGLILIAANILLRYRDFLESEALGREVPALVYQTIFVISSAALLAFIWLGLTMLLYIVPNTRVKLLSAVMGSTTAALIIYLFSRALLFFPGIFTSGRGALYGSLAVFPAVLVVFYLTWMIILYGATVGFVYQRLYLGREKTSASDLDAWDSFQQFENRTLEVLRTVYDMHSRKHKLVLEEELREALRLPGEYLHSCLSTLLDQDILVRRKTRGGDGYVPAKQPEEVDLLALHNLILRLEPGEEGQVRAFTPIDELKHTLGRLYSSGRHSPPLLYSNFFPGAAP